MTPQERRQTILQLLDHWPEFFEPRAGGLATSGAEPSGIALISPMASHPSVVELLRLLKGLRAQGRAHYRCVLAYFEAPWRITRALERDKHGHVRRHPVTGQPIVDPDPNKMRRARVLPEWLTAYPDCRDRMCQEKDYRPSGVPRPVCTAVDVLTFGWDRNVPLELPWPLMSKLRPLADADGWTEDTKHAA